MGDPLISPGVIGGLGGIQVQNLGGNVPVENHTGSLRQTNNQGLERNELKNLHIKHHISASLLSKHNMSRLVMTCFDMFFDGAPSNTQYRISRISSPVHFKFNLFTQEKF